MLKKILILAAGGMIGLSAVAAGLDKVNKSIELSDGSTVHFFKDGKMGMENRFGKTIPMKPNSVMEAKDGRRIIMIGNEVMRLEEVLHGDHRN